ncbi:MAG: zinc carboxypeptidase [Bacteroidia bacterium]|nr:zinc carboxypeptidase [Bacteroidia bacterium]
MMIYFIINQSFAQNAEFEKAQQYLQQKGEVYFKFTVNTSKELLKLTRIISIDNVSGQEVYAYANAAEFEKFVALEYPYEILTHPGDLIKNPAMYDGTKGIWDFDTYPTYTEYETMMTTFQTNYPNLCEIIQIGTTVDGRKLLFAKISDNVSTREQEPRFMYTSTMHGDETTGYILMLRLINYLLTNYGTLPEVANLVNNVEIWINPLENPDGTYAGGNSTVSGATRYNSNNVDLNRNYPNPEAGDHPDGSAWQPEALAMMGLTDTLHFIISANFHGGAEVANYPWDSWTSSQQIHADDTWWQFVSAEYADGAQTYGAPGYFTSVTSSGITNGGDWYVIYGSRQDYMTYYKFGRELTLEISDTKLLPAASLPDYWDYNYRSLINYMKQVMYGIRGTITDSITGEPLEGTATIAGHDFLNSHTISELPFGDYYRPIYAGTYDVTYDADGYKPKTYTVTVTNNAATILNAQLVKAFSVKFL